MFTRYLSLPWRNFRLRGFSLIELLISLIVISCITAAFTPLITKKFASGVFGGGGSIADITTECSKFGDKCTLCTSDYCIACVGLTCATDEYKDSKSCSCKKCADTYGSDCEVCDDKQCLTCPLGQYLDSDKSCKNCADKFEHCLNCNSTECMNCEDGYSLADGVDGKVCVNFSCSGDDFIQIDDLCITKKNMGDSDGLPVKVEGVNVVSTGVTCNSSSPNPCCWKGETASPCDSANGDYSGCSRTVCDHYAADKICSSFNAGGYTWRLATTDEMADWDKYSKGLGNNGLQLCDIHSGYLSVQCNGTISCPGSSYSDCLPYYVWSDRDNSYVGIILTHTVISWAMEVGAMVLMVKNVPVPCAVSRTCLRVVQTYMAKVAQFAIANLSVYSALRGIRCQMTLRQLMRVY